MIIFHVRGGGGLLVSRLSLRVFLARDHVSQKNRFKIQVHCNADNK